MLDIKLQAPKDVEQNCWGIEKLVEMLASMGIFVGHNWKLFQVYDGYTIKECKFQIDIS